MQPLPSADPGGPPLAADRPCVLWLDDERAADHEVAGAKAAALVTASRAGLPVVPGFVITTEAVEAIAAGASLPPEVLDAWRTLTRDDSRPLVVRSSSTVEDLGTSSMAGRFESVVGVHGLDGLRRAVDLVIASRGRAATGSDVLTGREPLAVLVQPLLAARCGGVLFGIDPVSGREDRLVAAAVRGGPDRLVSGEVDGSRYELERSGRLVEATRGEGGARLGRRHLRELAGLAARTAEVFGGPQDVEWAHDEGGRLRLLQSRPVTAERRGRPRGPVLGPGPVAETFPAPLQPLEADLWVEPLRTALGRALLLAGAASAADVEASPLITVLDGRAAVDLDLLEPRHRSPTAREWLDPRPRLRRLHTSWRVGRLRSALPSLARDVLAAADTALAGVPPLDDLDERRLVAVLHRLRPALLSVHAHELLVGLLADPGVPRATGTGTALEVLARARAAGRSDAETVAAQPVVLALAPPGVRAAPSLPADVAVPATGPGADDRPATDADDPGLLREALRLRVRWLQEVGARAAWTLGGRLAADGRLARAEEVGGLRLADLAALVDDPTAVASPRPVVPGDPLPARFRMSDTGRPVPVGGGAGATGAGGGTGSGPVHHGDDPPAGAVLVVRTLDPALAPVLPRLAGLVAETGSVLAHLAILAREAGVPTVVGAAGALERFAPGTVVRVDGTTGEVEEQDGA
ncbi:PEP/pyruvate-binding domain-containing protein [Geodermatophilus sp. DSM 44513]|uniref:PEP/pyruvate-binding domain-containing protein n=1 Tax=Geodermatophilus sp. DSM 44513 TaxID=1528104 RepID=UPI00128A8515|nr:PEP/pyruvate-binding domain-containing protein [Geodermatophilus sp. DSM 44513]WNV77662.1 PEP/pyruvate-binding domain-containing protein [Geodermatophilus sp. DSM 44513]